MKYVINATNPHLHYSYFIPIISLMWKAIGYTPITLLFGSNWVANPKTNYVLENIKKQSTVVWPLLYVPGFKESTSVQISRLFATACADFMPGDYVLTSDAVMIPLSKTWFHSYDIGKKFHIFGADAYNRNRFPICYLGATVADWRQVMDIHAIGINNAMQKYLDRNRDNWNYDEILFTEKIRKWLPQCHFIDRGWVNGIAVRRLDRINWNWQNQPNLIDCHSIRPGYTHWAELGCLFKAYCSDSDYDYIRNYTEIFNKI
jgi:hypothetical protein